MYRREATIRQHRRRRPPVMTIEAAPLRPAPPYMGEPFSSRSSGGGNARGTMATLFTEDSSSTQDRYSLFVRPALSLCRWCSLRIFRVRCLVRELPSNRREWHRLPRKGLTLRLRSLRHAVPEQLNS